MASDRYQDHNSDYRAPNSRDSAVGSDMCERPSPNNSYESKGRQSMGAENRFRGRPHAVDQQLEGDGPSIRRPHDGNSNFRRVGDGTADRGYHKNLVAMGDACERNVGSRKYNALSNNGADYGSAKKPFVANALERKDCRGPQDAQGKSFNKLVVSAKFLGLFFF